MLGFLLEENRINSIYAAPTAIQMVTVGERVGQRWERIITSLDFGSSISVLKLKNIAGVMHAMNIA